MNSSHTRMGDVNFNLTATTGARRYCPTASTVYTRKRWSETGNDDQLSDRNNARPTSPILPGYRTKDGSLDPKSDTGQYELGRNESLFDYKIYQLDYFYKLKLLPTEEKLGIEYFGFELEFWPVRDPVMKEAVFGYQMTDKESARDSVFAAGLAKLSNNVKQSDKKQGFVQEHLYPSSTQEYSSEKLTPSSKQMPMASAREAAANTRTLPPRSSYNNVTQSSEQGPSSCKTLPQGYPSVSAPKYDKKTGDENFRVAIQRGPNLIDEQMRKGAAKLDYRPGIGWVNKYCKRL